MLNRIIAKITAAFARFATVEMTFQPIAADGLSGAAVVELMTAQKVDCTQLARALGITRGRVHWLRVYGASAGLDAIKFRTALAAV